MDHPAPHHLKKNCPLIAHIRQQAAPESAPEKQILSSFVNFNTGSVNLSNKKERGNGGSESSNRGGVCGGHSAIPIKKPLLSAECVLERLAQLISVLVLWRCLRYYICRQVNIGYNLVINRSVGNISCNTPAKIGVSFN